MVLRRFDSVTGWLRSEYSVYEITSEEQNHDIPPSHRNDTNYIGKVEAESLEEAYEIAVEEYGSPVAVE